MSLLAAIVIVMMVTTVGWVARLVEARVESHIEKIQEVK